MAYSHYELTDSIDRDPVSANRDDGGAGSGGDGSSGGVPGGASQRPKPRLTPPAAAQVPSAATAAAAALDAESALTPAGLRACSVAPAAMDSGQWPPSATPAAGRPVVRPTAARRTLANRVNRTSTSSTPTLSETSTPEGSASSGGGDRRTVCAISAGSTDPSAAGDCGHRRTANHYVGAYGCEETDSNCSGRSSGSGSSCNGIANGGNNANSLNSNNIGSSIGNSVADPRGYLNAHHTSGNILLLPGQLGGLAGVFSAGAIPLVEHALPGSGYIGSGVGCVDYTTGRSRNGYLGGGGAVDSGYLSGCYYSPPNTMVYPEPKAGGPLAGESIYAEVDERTTKFHWSINRRFLLVAVTAIILAAASIGLTLYVIGYGIRHLQPDSLLEESRSGIAAARKGGMGVTGVTSDGTGGGSGQPQLNGSTDKALLQRDAAKLTKSSSAAEDSVRLGLNSQNGVSGDFAVSSDSSVVGDIDNLGDGNHTVYDGGQPTGYHGQTTPNAMRLPQPVAAMSTKNSPAQPSPTPPSSSLPPPPPPLTTETPAAIPWAVSTVKAPGPHFRWPSYTRPPRPAGRRSGPRPTPSPLAPSVQRPVSGPRPAETSQELLDPGYLQPMLEPAVDTRSVFWSDAAESTLPRGFAAADADKWVATMGQMRAIDLRPGCGNQHNWVAVLSDGTSLCAHYRQNDEHKQGELHAFYLARQLNLTNVAPVTALMPFDRLWTSVADQRTNAGWSLDRPVVVSRQLPHLEDEFIPRLLREDDDRRLNPDVVLFGNESRALTTPAATAASGVGNATRGAGAAAKEAPTTSLSVGWIRELVQWSDMLIFDYVTANHDRLVSNLHQRQWNSVIMMQPVQNLKRDKRSGLFVFVENGSSIVQGYRNLEKYQKYHVTMLNSLCVFRRRTIDRVRQLIEDGPDEINQKLYDMFKKNSPTVAGYLSFLPKTVAFTMHARLKDVQRQVEKCQARYGRA